MLAASLGPTVGLWLVAVVVVVGMLRGWWTHGVPCQHHGPLGHVAAGHQPPTQPAAQPGPPKQRTSSACKEHQVQEGRGGGVGWGRDARTQYDRVLRVHNTHTPHVQVSEQSDWTIP